METKRLLLAVALSVAIFLGWNWLSLEMGWLPPPPEQSAQNATQALPAPTPQAQNAQDASGDFSAPAGSELPPPAGEEQLAAFTPTEGRLVRVDTPLYTAIFHSNGGILRHFDLKRYHISLEEDAPLVNLISDSAAGQAPFGVLLNGIPTWTGSSWSLEGEDLELAEDASGVLRFSTEINGLRLVRELVFSGDDYAIREKLHVISPESRAVNLAFTFDSSSLSTDRKPSVFSSFKNFLFGGEVKVEEDPYNSTRVAWYQNRDFDEEQNTDTLGEGKLIQGNVSWIAVMNNYFMGAVSMNDPGASAKGRWFSDIYEILIGKTGVVAGPGADAELECVYYLGPKERKILDGTPNDIAMALDYGFFSIVAKPLIYLLDFFYKYVGNYGVAIILMTVVIKLLFWPLSQKSYRSMQQMRQLQPMMTKVREKYKDDKEALNREVMQLYKTYKINPAGGCLPILVQLPVFLGLYKALLNSIELRHAAFMPFLPFTEIPWLADLASPDPTLITPLVMGATMFLQQKMTPMPGDPTQAKIIMFMPLIFTVLFLGFPSGLVLYWLVNNVLSIGQQWWQLRSTQKA